MSVRTYSCTLILALLAGSLPAEKASAQTTAPAAATSRPAGPDRWTPLHEQLSDAIKGGDASQIASTLATLRATVKTMPYPERIVQWLMQAKRYDDAEQMAANLALDDPIAAGIVADAEKFRAQSFLAQGKGPESVSAARSYYDVARLKDSGDAINLLITCLTRDKTGDPTAAKRFKQQQIAWATPGASTEPSTSMGEAVLPSIPPDSKPYEGAAEEIDPIQYKEFAARGNLLLLEGKAKDAQDAFERAEGIAHDKAMAEAIENVARAIRAASGCIGPANAYVLKMRDQQQ